MSEITISFGKGEEKVIQAGQTGLDVIADLPEGRKKRVVALKIGDQIVDLMTPLHDSVEAELITSDSPEALEVVRHSTSHVMAQAVQRLFPGTKVTIGPAIDDGFYYDFDTEHHFTPDDFEKIENAMTEVIRKNSSFTRKTMPIDEAIELFSSMGERFKVELIEDLKAKGEIEVSLYYHDDWMDLCRGPHVPRTGMLQTFKLMKTAGAYWRGNEKNPMLQRLYGTAFNDKKALKAYLNFLEEAKKRDHRVLAKELDLFSIQDEAGAGLIIYHPNGAIIRSTLENWEKEEHQKRGYEIVYGPTLLRKDLWVQSGHFENYAENMYFTEIDEVEYGVKPMNCLSHMLIYKSTRRSYRDLPKRYFELGTVHRHEKSGQLNGLFRVRAFTQDDAHILCTPDQLDAEIKGVVGFVQDAMKQFGFEYDLEISTKPEKAIGSDEIWDMATNALKNALDDLGMPYEINEGDGAFYGPKIDVKLRDCLNRQWQCATIQCDFTMPDRFDLTYIGEDGKEHQPVMVHRVILGSLERFMGVLIEHFAGAFPVWLAPVQVAVCTITDAANEWAEEIETTLREQGIRVRADLRNEKIGYKIRHWQKQKVPYMLVVGEKEAEAKGVAPRTRKGEDLKLMPLDQFIERIRTEIQEKTLP